MKDLKQPDWMTENELDETAEIWAPTIVCEVKNVSDYLGEIPMDLDSDTYEHRGMVRPTAYYHFRCDNEYMYVIFAYYHFWDIAARHKHDFEGILLAVDKKAPDGVIKYAASIYHHEIKFVQDIGINALNDYFGVEGGGHGIEWNNGILRKPKNAMVYRDFRFESMDAWSVQKQEKIRKAFEPSVKLPDQWIDLELETYVKGHKPVIFSHRLRTTRGLFLNRPDILFELAKTRGMMR